MQTTFRKLSALAVQAFLTFCTAGCVNRLSAKVSRSFFVVKHANDSNGVAELIQRKLVAMGYQAAVGAEGAAQPAGEATKGSVRWACARRRLTPDRRSHAAQGQGCPSDVPIRREGI